MVGHSSPRGALAAHPGPLPAGATGGEREGEGRPGARVDPSDIPEDDWVERRVPAHLQPYARLARLDRPIGTWLLLFPGWGGIALASQGWPDPLLLVLVSLGAGKIRGAGWTLNGIANVHYDGSDAGT